MGPRVLRAVAVPWRTDGGGGIPLSARCRAKGDDETTAMFVIVAPVVVSIAHSLHARHGGARAPSPGSRRLPAGPPPHDLNGLGGQITLPRGGIIRPYT